MIPALPAPIIGALVTGSLGLLGATITAMIRSRKSKSSANEQNARADLDRGKASKEISSAFGELVDQLRRERAEDRAEILVLEQKMKALELRVDEHVKKTRIAEAKLRETERRCDRNIQTLCNHIDLLVKIMTDANLSPPAKPKLETSNHKAA